VRSCLTRTHILKSHAYIKQKTDRMDYLYSFVSCLMSCRRLYHYAREEIKMGITFSTIQQDL
jgi:hypothetical protein